MVLLPSVAGSKIDRVVRVGALSTLSITATLDVGRDAK